MTFHQILHKDYGSDSEKVFRNLEDQFKAGKLDEKLADAFVSRIPLTDVPLMIDLHKQMKEVKLQRFQEEMEVSIGYSICLFVYCAINLVMCYSMILILLCLIYFLYFNNYQKLREAQAAEQEKRKQERQQLEDEYQNKLKEAADVSGTCDEESKKEEEENLKKEIQIFQELQISKKNSETIRKFEEDMSLAAGLAAIK